MSKRNTDILVTSRRLYRIATDAYLSLSGSVHLSPEETRLLQAVTQVLDASRHIIMINRDLALNGDDN